MFVLHHLLYTEPVLPFQTTTDAPWPCYYGPVGIIFIPLEPLPAAPHAHWSVTLRASYPSFGQVGPRANLTYPFLATAPNLAYGRFAFFSAEAGGG
jgi:hypothetical protein